MPKINKPVKTSKQKTALAKTLKGFGEFFPILIGIIFLIGLLTAVFDKEVYSKLFTGGIILDPIIGAIMGSVAAGSPLVSYLIGGELLNQGISLVAVSAFIIAWVSVGVIQLPAEIVSLGRQFAISRNILSFISAVIISILAVLTLNIL